MLNVTNPITSRLFKGIATAPKRWREAMLLISESIASDGRIIASELKNQNTINHAHNDFSRVSRRTGAR